MIINKPIKYIILIVFVLGSFAIASNQIYAQLPLFTDAPPAYLQAVQEQDVALCQQLDSEIINECLYRVAISFNDNQQCEQIPDQEYKEKCNNTFLLNEAITEGNDDKCLQISSHDLVSQCLNQVLQSKDYIESYCQKFTADPDYNQLCLDIDFLRQAVQSMDITDCEQITTDYLKNDCQNEIKKRRDNDYDKDGIKNSEERAVGLNIFDPDTDNDGLSDYDESFVYKSNPMKADSDGDGIIDSKDEDIVGQITEIPEELDVETYKNYLYAIIIIVGVLVVVLIYLVRVKKRSGGMNK